MKNSNHPNAMIAAISIIAAIASSILLIIFMVFSFLKPSCLFLLIVMCSSAVATAEAVSELDGVLPTTVSESVLVAPFKLLDRISLPTRAHACHFMRWSGLTQAVSTIIRDAVIARTVSDLAFPLRRAPTALFSDGIVEIFPVGFRDPGLLH